ncbi:MAG: M48 family metallopeptidase [Sphingomicrobium sp.]
MVRGRLYDGVDASSHAVDVDAADGMLRLSQDNGWSESVEGSLLQRIDAPRGEYRIKRSDRPGWRLILPAEAEAQIGGLLGRPDRYGGWIDRIGLGPAAAIGALVTAAVVAIGYAAPRAIAPHVPASWERNIGAGLFGDFGSNRCRSAEGEKALEALVERIAPGSTSGPAAIRIAALDIPIYNAAALPGGYVVVFKPMITENETEALAGVLAHEIAHVRRRHVTEALIRELGIGALIRLFAGDLGANAEQIVALNYTRSNENEADADAIVMLRRANISPVPTARLFKKLAGEEGESDGSGFTAEFLRSHPLTLGRARRFGASAIAGHAYAPALERDLDAALFDICSKWKRPAGQ